MLATLDPSNPDDAHFTCVACGCVIEESYRRTPRDLSVARTQSERRQTAWLVLALERVLLFADLGPDRARMAAGEGRPGVAEKTFSNDTLGNAYRPRGEGRPPVELPPERRRSHYSNAANVPQAPLSSRLAAIFNLIDANIWLLGHGEHYKNYVIRLRDDREAHFSSPTRSATSICFCAQVANFRGRRDRHLDGRH